MSVEWINISKTIKKNILCDDVTLRVENGEILQLSGVNGSGKTSLLKIATGSLLPDCGLCYVDAVNTTDRKMLAGHIDIVLDEKGIHPKWSVFSHLSIFARMYGKERKDVEEIMEHYGLTAKSHDRASDLSLGFRQRLLIAIATISNPRNLLLDEPFNGLDARSVQWLQDYLKEYASAGNTVIFTAHNFNPEYTFADRVVEMEGGRIIGQHRVDSDENLGKDDD